MLNRINTFIQDYKLFNNSDQLALAISGGKDSVALAHILNQLNYKFVLIHCNFKLRGSESDADEEYVKELTKTLNNCEGFYSKSFQTEEYAIQNSLNTQLAARKLRYGYFEELYTKNVFTKLLTAHHKNDVVETFFINLNRGAGLRGLKSIPVRRSYIVRPMLEISSEEISNYLSENKISHREDSSNQTNKYLRNKLRNLVLPILENEMPGMIDSIANSAQKLAGENELLTYFIDDIKRKVCRENKLNQTLSISKSGILSYPQSTVILYRILDEYNFSYAQCEQIISSTKSGKLFYSDTHKLLVDRKQYLVQKQATFSPETVEINKPGIYCLNHSKLVFTETNELEFNRNPLEETISIPPEMFPLQFRFWQQGDYISPLGMGGKKLLSDFFIDEKISLFEKQNIPLLCKKNEVLWVCGKRISNNVKATQNKDLYHLSIIFEL